MYRIGTHVSQKSPLETVSDALDFVEIVRPFLYGPSRHPKYILNMDQTPVYYSMHEKKTLETKGVRTVNLRTCKNDSERITVGVTISADGDLLPPTIVFKGKCRIPFYIYYFLLGGALVLFFARERRSVWLFVFLVQPSHTFFNPYQILPAISEEHHRAPPIAHQRRHCQLRHNADPPPGSTLRTAWKVFVRLSKIGPCYRMRASFARAIALSDF